MKKYKIIIDGKEKEITTDNLNAEGSNISMGTILITTGSFYNSMEMVQDGINSGDFNINLQNSLGETPLHFAANQGFVNIIKLLLTNGAQFIPDDEGIYPSFPEELEDLEMYYSDIVRGEDEINIFKKYGSIADIIADYDNIVNDLFIYMDDDLDFDPIENLKDFTSVDELIASLKKTLKWKFSVIQEEIDQF